MIESKLQQDIKAAIASNREARDRRGRYIQKIEIDSSSYYIKSYGGIFNNFRVNRELRNLTFLLANKINCSRPEGKVVIGGKLYIVTKEIPNSISCRTYLENEHEFHSRRKLLSKLRDLFLKLIELGYYPQDLHLGNILLSNNELYLIDVNKLQKTNRYKFIATIVFNSHMLLSGSELSFMLKNLLISKSEARIIHRQFIKLCAEYAYDRTSRALKGNSDFSLINRCNASKHFIIDPVPLYERLVNVKPFKSTRSANCYKLSNIFAKLFHKHTKAKRCWENYLLAKYLNMKIAEPLGFYNNMILANYLNGSLQLSEFAKNNLSQLDRGLKNIAIKIFIHFVKSIYLKGAYHSDMKANNILVDPRTITFYLTDLEDLRLLNGAPKRNLIVNNLAQLNASLPEEISISDRLRGLKHLSKSVLLDIPYTKSFINKVWRLTVKRRHVWPSGLNRNNS